MDADGTALLAALAVATIFAVFARPFSDYHYWFSWSRGAFVAGTLLYLLLGGMAAGLLGWLIARLAKVNIGVEPTDSPIANGALYGMVGAVTVRADFRRARPISGREAAPTPGELAPAASLLGLGTTWCFKMMDLLVERKIDRWFKVKSDAALLKAAYEVAADIDLQDLTDSVTKKLLAQLVPAMQKVHSQVRSDKDEGRVRVRQFCAVYTAKNRRARQ
jgi:hypothetical protein